MTHIGKDLETHYVLVTFKLPHLRQSHSQHTQATLGSWEEYIL